MKKIISIILTLVMLLSTTAIANEHIKYKKSSEDYDYGSDYILKDKTGKIIPLAIGPLDGYSYAYIDSSKDFEVEKIKYTLNYNDLEEWQKDDMYIQEMSLREVFVGFDDGGFKPDKKLTRAEMATVFTRLFSLPVPNAISCFEDVSNNSWYQGYIMALVDKGVFKKDVNFNPDELVTREQLIAMTYRMLADIEFLQNDPEKDLSQYKDFDKVSEYARIPYKTLINSDYHMIEEVDYNDFEDLSDDEIYLNPQNTVTRLECCEYLYEFIRTFFINNAPAIKRSEASDIEIPVLDGSTSTYDITRNIYQAYYQNYENAPGFPQKHSKTTNSYKRLIDGEVEMIFVPDAGEDVIKYANEKGVKLKFIPIANEALIFFTGTGNKVDDITTEQLHNIYVNNSIANWKELGGNDNPLVAYCRNTDSGSHAQMENFILDGKEINENISKERTSIIMSSILTDVDNYNKENKDKFAMGYSLFYYYFNNQTILGPVDLKLLSINGIEPTEETISNGTYPFTTNYYAVIRDGENNPKVDAFAELMQSEFGDKIVAMSGLGVINAY